MLRLSLARHACVSFHAAHANLRRTIGAIFPRDSIVKFGWGKGVRTGIVQGNTTTSLLLCNPKTRRSSWVPIARVIWEDET